MTKRLEKFTSDLKEYLASYFEKAGFSVSDDGQVVFQYRADSYTDFLLLYVGEDTAKKLYSTMISGYRRVEFIERYWEEYKIKPLALSQSIPYTFGANMNEKDPRTYQLKNISRQEIPFDGCSIAEIGNKHIAFWEDRFKPWLDQYSEIVALNKEVNATIEPTNFPLNSDGSWFYKMIIARLAGDTKIDQIAEHLKGIYQRAIAEETNESERTYYQNRLWVTENLYQKLKNSEPLGNNPSLLSPVNFPV